MSTNEFRSSAARVIGESRERVENAERSIYFRNTFLDDCLRGILPHDLVLLGAPPGVGKTQLAMGVAAANVAEGKQVAFFALEAELLEIERRIKYAMITSWAHGKGQEPHRLAHTLNFPDWMHGRCEEVSKDFDARADAVFLKRYSGLHTFYRGSYFGYDELQAAAQNIAPRVQLMILDHLHYIDNDDDNESRGIKDTMALLRDLALINGVPIILVAHLRKKNMNSKQLCPQLEDFHGSASIGQQVTAAVTFARANDITPNNWWESPTYCCVAKDRRGGETGHVALLTYDKRTQSYSPHYTLGRLTKGDTVWEETVSPPSWAKHHKRHGVAAQRAS